MPELRREKPVKPDTITGQVDPDIGCEIKALLKQQRRSIRRALHEWIEWEFVQAKKPPPPKLASELATLREGRALHVRHVPTREQDD